MVSAACAAAAFNALVSACDSFRPVICRSLVHVAVKGYYIAVRHTVKINVGAHRAAKRGFFAEIFNNGISCYRVNIIKNGIAQRNL